MTSTGDAAFLNLLGRLLRLESGEVPADVVSELPRDSVCKHRLAPLAYSLGIGQFRDDFVQTALSGEFWKRGLTELLSAFDEEGIDACRLKGCAYFLDVYEDPGHRPMGDLDILVPPERFDDAGVVLRKLGYSARTTKDFVYAPSHHALTFDRGNLTVDLHRHMMQAGRSRIDIAGIWSRADRANHRPEPLDEIVLHISHMIRSELMVPLATFVDLALLLDQYTGSREQIIERCSAFRVERGANITFAVFDLLSAGRGGRAANYPIPSVEELVGEYSMPRLRQLLIKAVLVDGPRELAGLALTTLRERSRRWRN